MKCNTSGFNEKEKNNTIRIIKKWIYLFISLLSLLVFLILAIIIGSNSNYYFNTTSLGGLAIVASCSLSLIISVIFLIVHFKKKNKN